MSSRIRVPAEVPSVTQSSSPVLSSPPRKMARSPSTAKCSGPLPKPPEGPSSFVVLMSRSSVAVCPSAAFAAFAARDRTRARRALESVSFFMASLESVRVRHAAELAAGVLVSVLLAGDGVGDREGVFDARQCAVENPVLAIERGAVEDLDHHLEVGRVEEPEPAGIAGQAVGFALA